MVTNGMREVMWFFSPTFPGAYRPGSFNHALMQAMSLADNTNMARLTMVFPDLGHWFWRVKNELNALDELGALIKEADSG